MYPVFKNLFGKVRRASPVAVTAVGFLFGAHAPLQAQVDWYQEFLNGQILSGTSTTLFEIGDSGWHYASIQGSFDKGVVGSGGSFTLGQGNWLISPSGEVTSCVGVGEAECAQMHRDITDGNPPEETPPEETPPAETPPAEDPPAGTPASPNPPQAPNDPGKNGKPETEALVFPEFELQKDGSILYAPGRRLKGMRGIKLNQSWFEKRKGKGRGKGKGLDR